MTTKTGRRRPVQAVQSPQMRPQEVVEQEEETPPYPIQQSAAFAGSTLALGSLIDLCAHLGPTGLFISGLASYVAWRHGPELAAYLRGKLPADPLAFAAAAGEPPDPQASGTGEDTPKRGRTFWERALGIFPDEDEEEDDEQASPKEATTEEANAQPPAQGHSTSQGGLQAGPSGLWVPPPFNLEDVLDIVRAFNARGCIYFGESEQGAIAIPLRDMYHVIDVSSSGKGKSNRFRLAMMQMVNTCETYYVNPFAANVKAVFDARGIEVWKPLYDRLANKRPLKEGTEIRDLLHKLVEEIAHRAALEDQGDFRWMGRPIFVFIDELPEVIARAPEGTKLLDRIGRSGRQFCVFAWVASQTALTSEIGQSTAAQANYKTRIYGGGDKISCSRLMKGALPDEDERTLQSSGAGLATILADGMASRAFVRAPLVTNEALFAYLKLAPFKKEDWMNGGRRGIVQREIDGVSFSLSSSFGRTVPARDESTGPSPYEDESVVKAPLERDESFMAFKGQDENTSQRDESFSVSHEDEMAVIVTAWQLRDEGLPVTREAIKQRLGWNNAKHPIVKSVCDKHKIALR